MTLALARIEDEGLRIEDWGLPAILNPQSSILNPAEAAILNPQSSILHPAPTEAV
ncbi:MAG TPA: hypothetical protein VF883_14715 [Thermoanaerobaculia bacterium]|jgi:hypothetical protein